MRKHCSVSYVVEDDRSLFARSWILIMPCGQVRQSHAKRAPEALRCTGECRFQKQEKRTCL